MAQQALNIGGGDEGTKRTGYALTGVCATATAVLVAWAQQKPGFEWDGPVGEWIVDTLPGLASVAEAVAWPIATQWPFAGAILALVFGLSGLRQNKTGVLVLAALAGVVLVDWSLGSVLPSLGLARPTLMYGAITSALALGLHGLAGVKGRIALWALPVVTLLATLAAHVAEGGMASSVAMSALLVASWLLVLRHMLQD